LVLASPKPGETLLLYIAVTTQVIGAALVIEREEPGHVHNMQRTVCYIGKVLSNCETRNNQVQKLLYAILIMKRKLIHYLESHPVYVVTSHGLGEIVGNLLTTGRITKWDLELLGLDITYVPQTAIKSQALADSWRNGPKHNNRLPQLPENNGACTSLSPSLSMGLGEALC
jgi:hypothetical protein